MRRVFALVVWTAVTSGCAGYTPVYNGPFVETTEAALWDYWEPIQEQIRYDVAVGDIKYLSSDAENSGTFTIDSNGRVTEVVVVGSRPPGAYEITTKRQIKKWRYRPGKKNPDARPAVVQFTREYEGLGLEPNYGESED